MVLIKPSAVDVESKAQKKKAAKAAKEAEKAAKKLKKESSEFHDRYSTSLGMNSFEDRLLRILLFVLHPIIDTLDSRSSLVRAMARVACTHSLHGTFFLCRLKLRTKTGSSKATMQPPVHVSAKVQCTSGNAHLTLATT